MLTRRTPFFLTAAHLELQREMIAREAIERMNDDVAEWWRFGQCHVE
jgi:hypothetical protein